MKNFRQSEIVVTGIGITSAIGQGKEVFASNLFQGHHSFGVMKRPGRQKETSFLGAEIQPLIFPDHFSKKLIRTASFSGQVALTTLNEAWNEADLDRIDPHRMGLIIGGSNFQQRETLQTFNSFRDRLQYINPNYALSFMDSDVCGICTEQFGIKGMAYTIGGASASGQVAIIQGIQLVQSQQLDVCIVVGALMDLSYMELQAFRNAGAMGSDNFSEHPSLACRPFDKKHDGFIYGECCGVVVIERTDHALKRNANIYGTFTGCSIAMDGNRNPNSSFEGEVRVIKDALKAAHQSPEGIDYVNPHGTASVIGDETELKALAECRLSHAYINTTKSIIGHGLTAAGVAEVIVTLLQMKEEKLHPSRNLDEPIDDTFNWVKEQAVSHQIKNALNLSFGFGGMNTAICLQHYK
jgi:malonyl-ACP decarboxylase